MKTIARFLAAATILYLCGCSPADSPATNTQDRNEFVHSEVMPAKGTQMYPILKYTRDQSSEVLLKHEATDDEKRLFKRMDSAVVALTGDTDIDRCYEVIIPIGREVGLDEEDSIAFWTRMTFSEFEP